MEPESSQYRRRALVVLGMHRSGTSAVAGSLVKAGATPAVSLMGSALDNVRGFWEAATLADLDERILEAAGLHWDAPGLPSGDPGDGAGATARSALVEALAREYPEGDPWVVKDPRLCRLVPLLEAALQDLGALPVYVIVLRHPYEVAASVHGRDGTPQDRALLLWLQHTLAAERDTRGRPRLFVHYDDLLADWPRVMGRVNGEFGLKLEDGTGERAAEIDEFLTPQLRHHVLGGTNGGCPAWPLLERVWRHTRILADGDTPDAALADDDLGAWLERRVAPSEADGEADGPLLAALEAANRAIEAAPEPVALSEDEAALRRRALKDRDQRIAQLEADLRSTKDLADSLRGERDALAARSDEIASVLEQRESELANTQSELANTQSELDRAGTYARELEAKLAQHEAWVRDLQRQLERRLPRRAKRFAWRAGRYVFRRTPMPVRLRHALRRRLSRNGSTLPCTAADAVSPMSDGQASATFRQQAEAELEAFRSGDERLALPAAAEPLVTLVIVVYNQAALTLACLRSLAVTVDAAAEVVLVDNASADETPRLLDRLDGVRVIRNAENLHFLRAVNQAAAEARGQYLVLLNNDARLRPGTLEQALAVFDEASDVGAVGGRVIKPDGRLQEAGCIVWRDGSCLGYGRDQDPEDGRFLHRRPVDYCSGVFLVTPRVVFEAFGGFDEDLAPAYYEETDYCTRLRRVGYRVVYEPRAVVDHLEFGSSSGDAASELMQRNQGKFRDKHRNFLEACHYAPAPERIERAAAGAADSPRVLMVDDRFPHVDLGQGFPRANAIVHGLVSAGARVTVFATNEIAEPLEELYRDLPLAVECLCGHWETDLRQLLATRAGDYDVLVVSRPHNMERIRTLVGSGHSAWNDAAWIYDAEAIFSDRWLQQQELLGRSVSPARRSRMRAEEFELADRADIVTAVSSSEARKLGEGVDGEVRVLGTTVEASAGDRGFDARRDFLFVGALTGDETPNADSLVWFLREVWPTVRNRLEDARLRVVGINESPAVQDLAGSDSRVDLLGRVGELSPVYDNSRVFLAPTRYAAGLAQKCVEAAARGVPMVTTTLIADQLGWTDRDELLCAPHTEPEAFAEACVTLYSDPDLWAGVRERALVSIADAYAPAVFAERVAALARDATALASRRRGTAVGCNERAEAG